LGNRFLYLFTAISISLWTAVTSAFAASIVDGLNPDTAHQKETLDKLLAAGDTDSLVAAAAWGRLGNAGSAERGRLLHEAIKGADGSAYAYWLIHQICESTQPCDSREFEQLLRRVEPANGAIVADFLGRAKHTLSEVEVDSILESVADSERFDNYWNASVLHIARALARTRTMDLPTATVAGVGIVAAVSIPQFHLITGACKSELTTREIRLSLCRRVAAVLRRGDTYLSEFVGLRMATAAWPRGSAEHDEAESSLQVLRYRMKMQERLFPEPPWTEQFVDAYLDSLSRNRREQDTTVELMTAAGIAPMPDAEWLKLNPPPH
jgi:hypothetical protein